MTRAELPAVEEILPHRGGMVLLERLLFHDGDSTTAGVTVGEPAWLSSGGSVGAWLVLEYMAQCVAAHEGMLARAEGRALPRGLLVSARELRVECPRFQMGSRLEVRAERAGGRPGLGALSHACRVDARNTAGHLELAAEGRLSVALAWPCDAPAMPA